MGGMGVHLVNGTLVGDATVKANSPEALSCTSPTRRGGCTSSPRSTWCSPRSGTPSTRSAPSLFGHQFTLVGAGNRYGLPAFYELHTWSWKHNPMGTFMDYNPSVTCAHSTELYH